MSINVSDKKKEIGGYIELDKYSGEEYHKNAIALNSGRHCLEYLIKAKKIKKIYLPYFLCHSVKNICEKCSIEYEFYHIDKDFEPVLELIPDDNQFVYIVNYYGQKNKNDILKYKDKYKNIILDNAQYFFDTHIDGIDTIYTCRKFFGVADGGYLYTDVGINAELDTSVSYDKMTYVLGRFELGASDFYKQSVLNNKRFAEEPLQYMSSLTHNLLSGIDYGFVKKRRTENFKFLHKNLKSINRLKLTVPTGAFMYPLFVENGEQLKQKLISKKIYVPTLWPEVLEEADAKSTEYEFANNIVPLPVDQRYGKEDMEYIINCIKVD